MGAKSITPNTSVTGNTSKWSFKRGSAIKPASNHKNKHDTRFPELRGTGTHMSGDRESERDMQTVAHNPNVIEESDSRLIEAHNFNTDYGVDVDGDKDLVIADEESHDDQIDENTQSIDVGTEKQEFEPSWHPHVYGKPPKRPTPHSIEYILGINDKKSVSQLLSVKRFEKKFVYKTAQVQTEKVMSHKNKLQEQLLQRVRGVECEGIVREEPLNLSVPKKEWEEEKKGESFELVW